LIEELLEPLLYEDGPEDLLNLCKDQADIPRHKDNISTYVGPFHSKLSKDNHNPFIVESDISMPSTSVI
jgi:hypothetical protein